MPLTTRSANGKLVVRVLVSLDDNPAGIYCWINLVNGKLYTGSAARGLKRRHDNYVDRKGHGSLTDGKSHNQHLQRAWNKYGRENFTFVVLEVCDKEECLAREQYWMDSYESANPKFGYNICPTAGSILGMKQSDETKAKVSKALRNRGPESDETKAKRSTSLMGHSVSDEAREKIAAARRGKHLSDEHKAKLSAAGKGKTWKWSDESKARMSVIAKNRPPRSQATRDKISAAGKRRRHSPETKARIAASNREYHRKRKEQAKA